MIRVISVFCLLLISVEVAWPQSAPVLSNLEGDNLIYSEGDPTTPLTNTIQLSSEAPIVSARVQITDNYVAEQDRLEFTGTDDIQSVFDQETGTLLLLSYPAGSSGTAISFQNALRSIAYRNTNLTNPQAGLRSISFEVYNDQNQSSNSPARNLSVLTRDNAPELTIDDDAPILYTQPGSGQEVRIFDGLEITDSDGEFIESAEVTISEGYRDFEDELTLSGNVPGGINVSGAGSRTITFNGRATLQEYQNALRSIRFRNSTSFLVNPTEGNRKITVTANDGSEQSIALSRFVVVGNTTNAPPTISTVTKTATLGAELAFAQADFSSHYQDPEGNASFTGIFIRSQPQRGTLLFEGNVVNNSSINRGLFVSTEDFSELVYQPASDFTGEDRFLWNASDGSNFAANNAAVLITITAPELAINLSVPEAATAQEDTEVILPLIALEANQEVPLTATISVSNGSLTLPAEVVPLLSFTSGDGVNDLSMVFTGSPSAATYAMSGLRYLPGEDYNGPDVLSVSVSAASNVNDQGTMAITVVPGNDPFQLSNLETTPLNYAENDPPVRLTDQITIEDQDEESTLQIASATVTILEGYVAGEDSLLFPTLLNITGSQQDNVLTLSGVSDIGTYQSALRTVMYQNTSDNPGLTKTVAFTLRDEADSTSNTVIRDIIIQSVDDSLAISNLEDSPLNFLVGDEFTQISNQVIVSDPDTETVTQVVISMSEGYNPSLDSLYLEGFDDIASTWNDELGILTLAGDNTLERYTEALQAVRYRNNAVAIDDIQRTISIQASNDVMESEVVSRDVVLIDSVLEPLTIALAQESVLMCPGIIDSLSVTLVSGQTDVDYAWSCTGDCGFVSPTDQSTVEFIPTQTTQYIVSVSDPASGLQAQDTVTVVIDDCPDVAPEIPNGFTPNDDGANDAWVISNAVQPLTVEVFDRYGNSVYRSEDYQNDWDGTYQGSVLPVGTYYYIVSNSTGAAYKGAISILR